MGEFSKTTIGEFVIKTKQNPNSKYPVYNGGVSYTGFYDDFNNNGHKIIVSARGANAGFINIINGKYWAGNSCYSIDIQSDNYCIEYVYHFMKHKQHLFTDFQQAANIPSVSKKDVEEFLISYPKSKEEQTKIGNFFKQLDDTIALHQREFEKFKILRKAYLKHIFIDNTTQFRAEKTIPWEQRKLGDICNITTGKLDANAMVENGKYDFFTSGIKKYKIDHYAFLGPALTIAGNGATVGYMHYADGFFNAYQRTYVLTELLGDRTFLFSTINRKLQKKIQQEARAGNIPYIVLDMLTELDIYLPSLEEQTQIGNFFKQLDDTISLHQKELAKYQQIKTACLEKMFVE